MREVLDSVMIHYSLGARVIYLHGVSGVAQTITQELKQSTVSTIGITGNISQGYW